MKPEPLDAEAYRSMIEESFPEMLTAASNTSRAAFDATFASCCTMLKGLAYKTGASDDDMLAQFDWTPHLKQLFQFALSKVDAANFIHDTK